MFQLQQQPQQSQQQSQQQQINMQVAAALQTVQTAQAAGAQTAGAQAVGAQQVQTQQLQGGGIPTTAPAINIQQLQALFLQQQQANVAFKPQHEQQQVPVLAPSPQAQHEPQAAPASSQIPDQGAQASGGTNASMSVGARPFVVLTQLPIQATPFASLMQYSNQEPISSLQQQVATQPQVKQQQAQPQAPTVVQQQQVNQQEINQQQQYSLLGNASNWAQLLQQQAPPVLLQQQQQQQQQQQRTESQGETAQIATPGEQQQQQQAATAFLLQQLMRNAQLAANSADLTTQQQPQQQQQIAITSSTTTATIGLIGNQSNGGSSSSATVPVTAAPKTVAVPATAGNGLYTLGSTVEPVQRSHQQQQENDTTGGSGIGIGGEDLISWKKNLLSNNEDEKLNIGSVISNANDSLSAQPFLITSGTSGLKRKLGEAGEEAEAVLSAADTDDMAPIPLSEIRAKDFKNSTKRYQEPQRQQQTQSNVPSVDSNNTPTNLAEQIRQFQQQHQEQNTNQAEQHQQAAATVTADPTVQTSQMQQQITNVSHKKATGDTIVDDAVESSSFLLPSTMMPPSLLASILTNTNQQQPQKSEKQQNQQQQQQPDQKHSTGPPSPSSSTSSASNAVPSHLKSKPTKKKKTKPNLPSTESPQDVLERVLEARGYKYSRIKADQANYDTLPSPLQLASFGNEVIKAIHASDVNRLSKLLSMGLSPNPCNQFRDSIVDLVCKRSDSAIFHCLVGHGCDLRVCDGFGRTPLHHCCWASKFSKEIARTIIENDCQQLLIEDNRGQTPLEYVRQGQTEDWVNFLRNNVDSFFPAGGSFPPVFNLREERVDGTLRDPLKALPVKLAYAVSSGQRTIAEVSNMTTEDRALFQ